MSESIDSKRDTKPEKMMENSPNEISDSTATFKVASPQEIREEFQELVVRDLLGPRGGEDESFDGKARVTTRYLVGLLAPKSHKSTSATSISNTTRDDGFVTGGKELDPEDGLADKGTYFTPSSLGVSAMVVSEVESLKVTVSWGQYDKVDSEDEATSTMWKRRPIRIVKVIDLVGQDGDNAPTPLSSEFPGIELTVTSRPMSGAKLVSVFLTNGQIENKNNKDEQWMFQVSLALEATDGQSPIFVSRTLAMLHPDGGANNIDRQLEMQYRNQVEFAKGHGTSVHVTKSKDDPNRAIRIETTSIPIHEVPGVEAPSQTSFADTPEIANLLSKVVVDMKVLSQLSGPELIESLTPLADAYAIWLDSQEKRVEKGEEGLGRFVETGRDAISAGRRTLQRIRAGIELLRPIDGAESDVTIAFKFANEAMFQQRIRGLLLAKRASSPEEKIDIDETLASFDTPPNHSWRLFQIAFILVNLPSLSDVTHPERQDESALADLLFFPTGGGKTEAYLGLVAFTIAIRRLQGTIAGYDGRRGGIAVLMRYTLRLLTAQQFERASLLITACEYLRRQKLKSDSRWGSEPFRLGLWVGSSVTPNSTKRAEEEVEHARSTGGNASNSGPLQLSRCPWCGAELKKGQDVTVDRVRGRTLVYCSDSLGRCEFTSNKSPNEGIPVITVDDELYRMLPSFVISTVDKFAQLPLKGELHLLFGKTDRWCERHGYRSPDIESVSGTTEADSHQKKGTIPAAKTLTISNLRPPDLIIQDELHLITGPLGTMVALYEVAIDELSSYEIDGKKYRPKVVASTATIKQADRQVRAVFDRSLAIFPPPMLDSGDTFFAREVPIDVKPGRRYIGLCAQGTRLKEAEVRIFSTLLSAGQFIWNKYGVLADPWMTLVGYFSALRELAGARRLIDDQVNRRAYSGERYGLAKRSFSPQNVGELTSRVRSAEILKYLTDLGIKFDGDENSKRAISVLLATNMISVGVDVPRLGLMCVVGQPKETSEYIQATSRVGRSSEGPGLVFTLLNWSRPRDMSHYENFEFFHSTFYKQVEPLSVTPFSERALDRGLSAVVVSLTRHKFGYPFANQNGGAKYIKPNDEYVQRIKEVIKERAARTTSSQSTVNFVNASVQARFDEWHRRGQDISEGASLGYRSDPQNAITQLLESPEPGTWRTFTVQWSLRETEPEINLVLEDEYLGKSALPAFEMSLGDTDPLVELPVDDSVDGYVGVDEFEMETPK